MFEFNIIIDLKTINYDALQDAEYILQSKGKNKR